jgi:hypothetical protein
MPRAIFPESFQQRQSFYPVARDFVGDPEWGTIVGDPIDQADLQLALAALQPITLLTTKTANYTATISDGVILVDASGGGVTITLPPASGNPGVLIKIKKIDTTSLAVTIDGNAAETIDGGLTAVIVTPYVALAVQCDGTKWWIV